MKTKSNRFFQFVVLAPIIVYSVVLVVLPLLYVLFLSFLSSDSYGGIVYSFSLQNYFKILDPVYLGVFLKSFFIAFITTVLCILIAYPFCIFVSQKSPKIQKIMISMVMIPFLANSLIRTYGWVILLRKEGVINSLLSIFGMVDQPLSLMYNYFGIIIGMVYTLLPFMILPVYNSICKIDRKVIEASSDLGASKLQTFFQIIVPQTMSGVFNGSLMVFIPAIGYFFISDILGGGKIMLIGNLIKNQFLVSRNWPFGAAVSIVLILITFLLVKLYQKIGGDMDDLGGF